MYMCLLFGMIVGYVVFCVALYKMSASLVSYGVVLLLFFKGGCMVKLYSVKW